LINNRILNIYNDNKKLIMEKYGSIKQLFECRKIFKIRKVVIISIEKSHISV